MNVRSRSNSDREESTPAFLVDPDRAEDATATFWKEVSSLSTLKKSTRRNDSDHLILSMLILYYLYFLEAIISVLYNRINDIDSIKKQF